MRGPVHLPKPQAGQKGTYTRVTHCWTQPGVVLPPALPGYSKMSAMAGHLAPGLPHLQQVS